jgi:hypothetical protein
VTRRAGGHPKSVCVANLQNQHKRDLFRHPNTKLVQHKLDAGASSTCCPVGSPSRHQLDDANWTTPCHAKHADLAEVKFTAPSKLGRVSRAKYAGVGAPRQGCRAEYVAPSLPRQVCWGGYAAPSLPLQACCAEYTAQSTPLWRDRKLGSMQTRFALPTCWANTNLTCCLTQTWLDANVVRHKRDASSGQLDLSSWRLALVTQTRRRQLKDMTPPRHKRVHRVRCVNSETPRQRKHARRV